MYVLFELSKITCLFEAALKTFFSLMIYSINFDLHQETLKHSNAHSLRAKEPKLWKNIPLVSSPPSQTIFKIYDMVNSFCNKKFKLGNCVNFVMHCVTNMIFRHTYKYKNIVVDICWQRQINLVWHYMANMNILGINFSDK